MLSLLPQIIGSEGDLDGLLSGLLLLAFLILLLPSLAATITGIVCGIAMPGTQAGWGAVVGLALGVAATAINIVGPFLLRASLSFWPEDWARVIFCPESWRILDDDEFGSICGRSMRWELHELWRGISLTTSAVAAAATWWLCRRRSVGRREQVTAHD